MATTFSPTQWLPFLEALDPERWRASIADAVVASNAYAYREEYTACRIPVHTHHQGIPVTPEQFQ